MFDVLVIIFIIYGVGWDDLDLVCGIFGIVCKFF